ncbi:hypothetical protein JOF53_001586 [Crossiella equi]|uniref:Uncharacterized protein n=1 Tax=Crossiella equi TaxID=130796 RepID=A0ABS5A805_9PSEU|nr:hypothetical protein [Crossiella equi]MBP2472714.1 hypothetical protein [Crossiella equi]
MTGVDRAGSASARLLAAARPELYRRNAFRLTGLATDASPRVVRQRRQVLLHTGDGPDAELRTALDELADTEARLVAELFWLWGEPGACGCPAQAHAWHDNAVTRHAQALDHELDGTAGDRAQLWQDAQDAWLDALDLPGFWDHVRARVAALRDRRLDESTVEGLREGLLPALLAPQVELAAARRDPGLMALLDEWEVPGDLIHQARLRAAEPVLAEATAVVGEFDRLHDEERLADVHRRHHELVAALHRLEAALPHERFRQAARQRDRAAIVLNNCATALMDVPGQDRAVLELLAAAEALVVEEEGRARIRGNLAFFPARDQLTEVTRLLQRRRFHQALALLHRLRAEQTDPELLAQVNGMITQLDALFAGQANAGCATAGPLAGATVAFGYLVVLGHLLLGQGDWTYVLTAVLLSPLPMTVVRARWFRHGPRLWHGALGVLGVLATVALLVGLGLSHGSLAPLWAVLAFWVALPVSTAIGQAVAR